MVVGGGLAGASVAYHLVSGGARTALIDRADEGRATDAGAGILSPPTAGDNGEGWPELVAACGARYPRLIEEIGDAGYARCGLLAVALADWDVEAFEQLSIRARSRVTTIGEIDPADAAAAFPPLANVTRALSNPDAARVDGRLLARAILTAAQDRGLEVIAGSVERLTALPTVDVGGRQLNCGAVVVAGGAWSPALGSQLGVDVPISPERGQIIHVRTAADTDGWPIVQPVLGAYLVPWPGGRVAIGATREPDAGFAATPTVRGIRQIFNEVKRVAPGLLDAEFVEVRVGLRPHSVDDRPVLGPLLRAPHVHLATGYGANGLLLSPWCGEQVAAAILGLPVAPGIEAFSPARFPGA